MKKLKIFCTSLEYLKILDKLPGYVSKIGLGANSFPSNWFDEKKGINISHLNKYYGEFTGIYWIWKNLLNKFDDNDLVGNCHYRKLWLNDLYTSKNSAIYKSLYSRLLSQKNPLLSSSDTFQVQPIIFKNKNLLEDFKIIHKNDSLDKSINFLEANLQKKFKKHLLENKLYPLNMFITTPKKFNEYCEIVFPWLEKCLDYCKINKLCEGYNLRMPAFLAERFTSFWFSQNSSSCLSYARLGNIFLSNRINNVLNPIKLPFTFKMYPTLHRY